MKRKKLSVKVVTLDTKAAPCASNYEDLTCSMHCTCEDLDPFCAQNGGHSKVAAVAYF